MDQTRFRQSPPELVLRAGEVAQLKRTAVLRRTRQIPMSLEEVGEREFVIPCSNGLEGGELDVTPRDGMMHGHEHTDSMRTAKPNVTTSNTPAGSRESSISTSTSRSRLECEDVAQQSTCVGGRLQMGSSTENQKLPTVLIDLGATPFGGGSTTPGTLSVPSTTLRGRTLTGSITAGGVRSPPGGSEDFQIPDEFILSLPDTHARDKGRRKFARRRKRDDHPGSRLAGVPPRPLPSSSPDAVRIHVPPPSRDEEAEDGANVGGADEPQRQWSSRGREKALQKLADGSLCRLRTYGPPFVVNDDDVPAARTLPTLLPPSPRAPPPGFPRASDSPVQSGTPISALVAEHGVMSPNEVDTSLVARSQYHKDGESNRGMVVEEVRGQQYEGEQEQLVDPDPNVKAQRVLIDSLGKSDDGDAVPPNGGGVTWQQPDDTRHTEPNIADVNDSSTDREARPRPNLPSPQRVPATFWISRSSAEDVSFPQVESAELPPCSYGQHLRSVPRSYPQLPTYWKRVGDDSAFRPRQGNNSSYERQRVATPHPIVIVVRGGRPRLNAMVPGRPKNVADRECAINVASGKTDSAQSQRSLTSNIRGSVSPVLPRLSVDPRLAGGKFHAFPEIRELEEKSEHNLLERGWPVSDNPAKFLERHIAAVVDVYPFANGYASDIGSDIDSLDALPFAGGAFGNIRRGFLNDGRQVAIKFLRSSICKLEKKLLKEIRVWSLLKHENVLPLLGLCVVNNELGMVSEFMSNGNIKEYIRRNPDVDRYWLAIHVCAGLAYLHEHPKHVIHGDLKAVNVVVDHIGIPKLVDFGLAKTIRAEDSTDLSSSSSIGGTARWMARELIVADSPNTSCLKPNSASDVYSLGMTIYEMFSGTFPFAGRKNDTQVIAAIMRDEFPERTLNVFTDGLWELLLRCWQRDPPKRPTAREVLVTLQDLHRLQSDCIDST